MIRKPSEMNSEVRSNMRDGTGNVTIRHYFKKDEFTSKTRLCARLTLPPGASIGTHPHENEDEIFIIVKGTGIIEDGDTRAEVTEGDAILTGGGASHAVSNTGDSDLDIIAVINCC